MYTILNIIIPAYTKRHEYKSGYNNNTIIIDYLCSGAKTKDSERKNILRTVLPQNAIAVPRTHSSGEIRRGQSCSGLSAPCKRTSIEVKGKASTAGRLRAFQISWNQPCLKKKKSLTSYRPLNIKHKHKNQTKSHKIPARCQYFFT